MPAIPVGTVIPGTLIQGEYKGDRDRSVARRSGRTAGGPSELSRDLMTGSKYDMQFEPGRPIYLYVSAFDNNQTRHTRHMRPIVMQFD